MPMETISVDNKSGLKITHIQIDEFGENVKVKLECEDEHRAIVKWYGQNYIQTLWMSAERKKELGIQ